LPRETRGYVPSFIAATMIAQNPTEFGFQEKYEGEPYQYETADVTGSIELSTLAECAGISLEEMKEYNPELIRWATPPGNEAYPLKLPVGVKETFEENLKKLPPTETRQLFIHTVKRGETLGRIANKYGTTVRDLYLANGDLKTMIYPNQQIVIPVPQSSGVQILADQPSNAGASRVSRSSRSRSKAVQPANTTALTYKVKKGDTIGHIAEWYGTKASNVRGWNNTSNTIRVGENLTIYVPKSQAEYYKQMNTLSFAEKQRLKNSGGAKRFAQQSNSSASGSFVTYTVQKNDNLSKIASSFNTSVS
jgi:membrane-bound lytic murein transglycosylase D